MGTILLVRHGQTDWNADERFRGRFDIPLNEHGLRQAEAAAGRISSGFEPDAIITSPLARARRTAEAIALRTGSPVRECPGLIDIDYGRWQGLSPHEAAAAWPEESRLWREDPGVVRVPGGETLGEVRKRAVEAVRAAGAASPHTTLVMVSHTVVIRLILLDVLESPMDRFWAVRQEPCAINLLEFDGSSFAVVSVNDTCHLRGL